MTIDPTSAPRPLAETVSLLFVSLVFLVSGFAALIYQVVWQRTLFAIYGVNIESVTIVVTTFMVGLGLGSLAGGRLSLDPGRSLLRTFGALELSIGGFGLFSLKLFHWVGIFTAGRSVLTTLSISFALLLLPTLMMGATLPLLVTDAVRRLHNVGRSVSILYFVNTLGSAFAALATSIYLLGRLGQQATVTLAAALNLIVGSSVLLASRRDRRS
jgi:spermidine synthase